MIWLSRACVSRWQVRSTFLRGITLVPGGLGVKAWPAVPGLAKNPEVRKLNCASPLSFQQCLGKKATDAIHLKQARQQQPQPEPKQMSSLWLLSLKFHRLL